MRQRGLPLTYILHNIIIFFSLVTQGALTVELSICELALIPRPIGKLIDSMSVLFVVEPVSSVGVSIGPGVGTVAMFEFVVEVTLVPVTVAEISSVPLHLICQYNETS